MKRSKYWGFVKRRDQAAKEALRNSLPPFHTVTHREPGDIPGLILAPRDSIFRSESAAVVEAELSLRSHHYSLDVESYINGNIPKEHIFRAFERPIYGPYGEKL